MDFAEWSKTAVSLNTLEVNREVMRDLYVTPNGSVICHDVRLPRWMLGKQTESAYVAWNIPYTPENIERIKEFGGKLDDGSGYCERGYSWAWFDGDDSLDGSLERAFNFVEKYQKIIFTEDEILQQ